MAVGVMRMSRDDFEASTMSELEAAVKAWSEQESKRERGQWERMRLLACVTIQPHVRKKLTPQELFGLPWDREPDTCEVHQPQNLTLKERKAKFEAFMSRRGEMI